MGQWIKSDFVFLGAAVLVSLLFASGLGGSAVMGLLGYAGMPMSEVMLREELNASRALLAQQGLGSLALFLLPGVAMLQRWSAQQSAEVAVESPALPRAEWSVAQTAMAWSLLPALLPLLEWATGQWMLLLESQNWAAEARAQVEMQAQLVERVLFLPHWIDAVLGVLVFVGLAAVGEELFFRGALQRMLRPRWGQGSVLASALLFAGFHFDLLHLPFLLTAGFLLAWLYERSGRLWVPVGAHVLHNAVTYLQAQRAGPGSYAEFSAEPLSWTVAAGTLAAVALWVALRRR
ncbi:MAG: lysostaphin resistance A-like protein [Schleiferiaceae bacterium]|jgi:membrane protease YdiL (CAAX protease family)